MANEYCTVEAVKQLVNRPASDTRAEAEIEAAVEAASRDIDAHCGRRFYADTSTADRKYMPVMRDVVHVDDISTLTGLVVKVDENGDGTFETTLTIGTDFQVEPVNAALETPVWPYTRIRLITDGTIGSWPMLSNNRPPVQVTATFGWPAIPGPVERACAFQAANIFKSPDMIDNAYQLTEEGAPIRKATMHRMATRLLAPFVRWDELHDE